MQCAGEEVSGSCLPELGGEGEEASCCEDNETTMEASKTGIDVLPSVIDSRR